jgi:hypothetical protein
MAKNQYANAPVLATFEHLGLQFNIVQRLARGKPTGSLECLHDGAPMASVQELRGTPEEAAAWLLWKLQTLYPESSPGSLKRLHDGIAKERSRAAPVAADPVEW